MFVKVNCLCKHLVSELLAERLLELLLESLNVVAFDLVEWILDPRVVECSLGLVSGGDPQLVLFDIGSRFDRLDLRLHHGASLFQNGGALILL